ncbi:MAG: DinB family protein [Balneolaceae bacterium]
MGQRQQLQKLFQFDLWCTRKLTDFIVEVGPFKERTACIAFLSHIVNAQQIWFERVIETTVINVDIWTEHDVEELKSEAKLAHQLWIDVIADHEMDLDTVIYYQNTKQVNFKSPFIDICNHLIIHGQHHRAQISLLLRQSGIAPPPIDYIHYTRKISD